MKTKRRDVVEVHWDPERGRATERGRQKQREQSDGEQRWKGVGGERSREREGDEQRDGDETEQGRQMEIKARRKVAGDLVRRAERERSSTSKSPHSGLEGPATVCSSPGATLQEMCHRGEAAAPWEPRVPPAAGSGHSFQLAPPTAGCGWARTRVQALCQGWGLCAPQASFPCLWWCSWPPLRRSGCAWPQPLPAQVGGKDGWGERRRHSHCSPLKRLPFWDHPRGSQSWILRRHFPCTLLDNQGSFFLLCFLWSWNVEDWGRKGDRICDYCVFQGIHPLICMCK